MAASGRYYDAYTVHREKVAAGLAQPGDFSRSSNSAADITTWAIAIATVAGLYVQTQHLRIAREAQQQRG